MRFFNFTTMRQRNYNLVFSTKISAKCDKRIVIHTPINKSKIAKEKLNSKFKTN